MGRSAKEELAIDGGNPIRKDTLPLHAPMIGEEEVDAAVDVLKSGMLSRIWGGRKCGEFEVMLSEYFGVKHAVAVNTGTSALHAVLSCMGIGPGDEVIIAPLGFIATGFSVCYQNAVPVYADVDPIYLNIDAEDIRRKITERTKAIMVVHLWGHPADMDQIMEVARANNLKVIEDCAQAIGAEYKERKVGSIGDVSCFSLVQTKVITCGEGGFILMNDGDLASKIREFCNFCRSETELRFWGIGYNYRMPEIMGAVAMAQLHKLDSIVDKRRRNAQYLTAGLEGLEGIGLPREAPWAKNVWWMYPLRLNQGLLKVSRDRFVESLQYEGIAASHLEMPDYLQAVFSEKLGYGQTHCPFECPLYHGHISYEEGLCPNAEKGAAETVWLPGCSPAASRQDTDDVVAAVKKVVSAYGSKNL